MISLATLGIAGGLLSLLITNHFIVDWLPQSHAEAMAKHKSPKVRAKHCLIYTLGFIPLLLLMHMSLPMLLIALNVLFWSHFIEDTYIPVFLWAKYVRKPPEMTEPIIDKLIINDEKLMSRVLPPDPIKGFAKFVDTTLGKILMIAVDQIIHIIFLIPIVILALLN